MDHGTQSPHSQAGCIPCRLLDGRLLIALITSRRSRRWVIPKGIIDPGEAARQTAEREAWEEAGLKGELSPAPLGHYGYRKYGIRQTVQVYVLRVHEELDRWPESSWRARHWMTPAEAAACTREEALLRLILEVPGHLRGESDK